MAHRYLLGLFDDEETLIDAVRAVKDKGLEIHDVLTPFPVHGLEKALEMKESRLHTAGFITGALGTMTALGCMTYITTLDWPVNVGGKPNFALLAFVPITFELTVLFSAVGMTVIYYLRNRLSIFKDDEVLDNRITDDRFVIAFDMGEYHGDVEEEESEAKRKGKKYVDKETQEHARIEIERREAEYAKMDAQEAERREREYKYLESHEKDYRSREYREIDRRERLRREKEFQAIAKEANITWRREMMDKEAFVRKEKERDTKITSISSLLREIGAVEVKVKDMKRPILSMDEQS